MRPFFMTVGILAWLWAFAVMWIFAERGGALTVIAAGVFAIVAILALGCERILQLLEQIRDRRLPRVISREDRPLERPVRDTPAHSTTPEVLPS